MIGGSLAVLAALTFWNIERRSVMARYEDAAENRISAFEREMASEVTNLTAVWLHTRNAPEMTQEEFTRFVGHVLPDRERRSTYFWAVREQLGGPFRIQSAALGGAIAESFGPYVMSEPDLTEAAELALRIGKITTTERVPVKEKANAFGVFLLYPVFEQSKVPLTLEDRRQRLLGFVGSFVEVGQTMERGLQHLRSYGIDVHAFDLDAPAARSSLYSHWSRRRDNSPQPAEPPSLEQKTREDYERIVTVGNRSWLIRCQPVAEKLASGYTGHPWIIFGGGLVISLLTAASFRTQQDRTAKVERLVTIRTKELSAANERLRDEVQERKRAQEELAVARDEALESSRLKSQFLANVSHEIRTPLNGILGMTDFLMDTQLSDEQRELAGVIQSSGHSLLAIINDLLDMAKIEAGKLALSKEEFELLDLVDEVLSLIAGEARKKGLELNLRIGKGTPNFLRGDSMRLRQVLLNLLGNSVKFTNNGTVRLDIAVENRQGIDLLLRFGVQDTGIGIEPEAQKRLFHRFTQADGTSSRRFGGTGLGLAISKQLVDLMNGDIGMTSEPGKGSTFWFTTHLETVNRPRQRSCSSDLCDHARVLIAGVSATSRQLLRSYTQVEGLKVAEAESALAAIELARRAAPRKPFSLIIVDVENDQHQGGDLVRSLQDQSATADTPLILVGPPGAEGSPTKQSDRPLLWINKPVKRRLLAAKICEALCSRIPPAPDFEALGLEPDVQCRVLLAEDNPVNQRVAVRFLEKLGCTVEAVADGSAAISAAARANYDVILMDCQMPEVDGFRATQEIRARESGGRRTPIVALTANAMKGDRERCIQAEMDDYLPKPIQLAALAAVLRKWGAPRRNEVSPRGKSTAL